MPRMRACHRRVRDAATRSRKAPATSGSEPLTDTSKKKGMSSGDLFDPFKSLENPAKRERRQAHARRESK